MKRHCVTRFTNLSDNGADVRGKGLDMAQKTYGIKFYPSIEAEYTRGIFIRAENYWNDAHLRFRAAYPEAIIDSHFDWEPTPGVTYEGWSYLEERTPQQDNPFACPKCRANMVRISLDDYRCTDCGATFTIREEAA